MKPSMLLVGAEQFTVEVFGHLSVSLLLPSPSPQKIVGLCIKLLPVT